MIESATVRIEVTIAISVQDFYHQKYHCFTNSRSALKFYDMMDHVVVITTAQIHSTKPELMFCAGSNHARGVSEI